ncbi:MAG: hypothetical protein RXQ75_10070 [Acidianus hospitalis]
MRLCIIIAIISIILILLGDVLLPLIPLISFYPTYEGIKYNTLYQNGAEIQYIGMTEVLLFSNQEYGPRISLCGPRISLCGFLYGYKIIPVICNFCIGHLGMGIACVNKTCCMPLYGYFVHSNFKLEYYFSIFNLTILREDNAFRVFDTIYLFNFSSKAIKTIHNKTEYILLPENITAKFTLNGDTFSVKPVKVLKYNFTCNEVPNILFKKPSHVNPQLSYYCFTPDLGLVYTTWIGGLLHPIFFHRNGTCLCAISFSLPKFIYLCRSSIPVLDGIIINLVGNLSYISKYCHPYSNAYYDLINIVYHNRRCNPLVILEHIPQHKYCQELKFAMVMFYTNVKPPLNLASWYNFGYSKYSLIITPPYYSGVIIGVIGLIVFGGIWLYRLKKKLERE